MAKALYCQNFEVWIKYQTCPFRFARLFCVDMSFPFEIAASFIIISF